MASTRHLQERFRPLADWLIEAFKSLDPDFVITSAYRSPEDQQRLYDRWLAGDPEVLTPAPPGRSQHERGWAVDIARAGVDAKEDPVLAAAGRWWRSHGGVWGGEADPVHFEAPKAWTGRT